MLGLFVGIAASREWQTFLLWHNSTGLQFGNPDPLFHRDPSFYIFSMPWLKFVQGWLFSALVGITLLTGLGHYLWGRIRPQARDWADKVVPAVRAHLSVLFGLIMIAKAWGYWLGRFDLLTSPRGVVEGATYTDVHAQLPALNFLAIVALICAVLFLVNIRVRLWSLPVIAVGLLLLVSVLLGAAYPAFIQQIRVKPQELQQEQSYITDNIRATRRAFGLDKIQVSQKTVAPAATRADVTSNDPTISNIRLWRPSVLLENFQSLQRLRQYYEFKDVDVDRYSVNGQPRVLMVAGREVTQSGIPGGGNWQNKHLIYTHGFGPVAAQVNSATAEGAPAFTVHDIPPVGFPNPAEPRLYYGEVNDVPYVVVGTKTDELDYEGASSSLKYRYQGDGGIPIGNVFERALFAWRYKDVNLLISNLIDANSRIMIYRDIQTRVQKAAPFLKFDGDPYLAIIDGRMQWIWDAYTTTTQYPVLAVDRPLHGDEDPDRVGFLAAPLRLRELHPQLREGRRRRVQRHPDVLRRVERHRPDPQRLGAHLSGDVHAGVTGEHRSPRALPLSREPLPGPGVPVRPLPRRRTRRPSSRTRTRGRSRSTRRCPRTPTNRPPRNRADRSAPTTC